MNKILILTKRNTKEIIRDPLSLIFCIIFPVVMLVLMQLLFKNMEYVPENFAINNYAVGICVFGFTFVTLFTAMLMSSDKNCEFINRIKTAPTKNIHSLVSYLLSSLPISFVQTLLFFIISIILGLEFSIKILLAILYLIPSAIFYISLGILIGCLVKNEKQAGPVSSIFISATGMLGGIFMPISNLGTFSKIANLLPFAHTTKIASEIFSNNANCFTENILWIVGYLIIIWFITVLVYNKEK